MSAEAKKDDWDTLSAEYPQFRDEIREGLGIGPHNDFEKAGEADPASAEKVKQHLTTIARSFAQKNRDSGDVYRQTLDAFNRFKAVVLTAVTQQSLSHDVVLEISALLHRLETMLQLAPANAHTEIARMAEDLSRLFKAIRRKKENALKFSEVATRISTYVNELLQQAEGPEQTGVQLA